MRMNNLKRAFISLSRQPIKSGIFLLLVFILGVLIAGAISVNHAIMHTNHNLRNRMPAVAMIQYSHFLDSDPDENWRIYQETGEWPEPVFEPLTREVFHEISNLEQVRYFDYFHTAHSNIIAYGLEQWWDEYGWDENRIKYDFGVELNIGGVATVDALEMRADFIELIAGRGFTEEELLVEEGPFPTLIAAGFAEVNGLSVGSVFDSRVINYEWIEFESDWSSWWDIDPTSEPTLGATFPLEVIGIFDPILGSLPYEDYSTGVAHRMNQQQASLLQHRIYVSNLVAQEMITEVFKGSSEDYASSRIMNYFYHIFILNDPHDFEDFAYAVQQIPGNNDYWRAIDYSSGFEHLSVAMIHLQDIADMILLGAIIATIGIISLLVLLFLSDRKHEIGVYLALGSKKKSIVFQIIFEIITLSIIGMTCALFVGNHMARNLSQEMLENELANSMTIQHTQGLDLERLGYRFSMTHDDMLDAYEIQLGTGEIIWFYVVGLGTVTIATIFPIVKIVKTNPKKVLL